MKRIISFFIVFIIFVTSIFSQSMTVDYGNNSQAGHYAPVNGIQLYYEIYGSGEPLIMLHGNSGSMNAFSQQIPFFEKYYQVIAVDSRLQGKSGGSPDTLSYELMASDFCELMDYLKIDSANVLGWSDGGINGIIMAMSCPSKVTKLAISGANVVPDTTALTKEDLLMMKNFIAQSDSASKTAITLVQMMIDQPNIPYKELSKIKCPVLVMAGDQDMIKHEHTIKIFRSISKASLCIFPDAHHGVCQQYPELFNETVLSFLKK